MVLVWLIGGRRAGPIWPWRTSRNARKSHYKIRDCEPRDLVTRDTVTNASPCSHYEPHNSQVQDPSVPQ